MRLSWCTRRCSSTACALATPDITRPPACCANARHPQAVLAELAAEAAGQGELLKGMTGDTKELHGAVSKLGKVRWA